jgi:hypothetical protein
MAIPTVVFLLCIAQQRVTRCLSSSLVGEGLGIALECEGKEMSRYLAIWCYWLSSMYQEQLRGGQLVSRQERHIRGRKPMDRVGRFSTPDSSEKRFRKRFGIDNNPKKASYKECENAIYKGIQGLKENNNLSVRELKDQVNVVSNWIKMHEKDFSPDEKDQLKKLWNEVHDKFLNYKYLKYYNSKAKDVKDAIAKYLDYAQKKIEATEAVKAIWRKRQDQFKNLNRELEEYISFIEQHPHEFKEIGYTIERFMEIKEKASHLQDGLQVYYNDQKYINPNDKETFIKYQRVIQEIHRQLRYFVEIDRSSEVEMVSERKKRIDNLLKELPQNRPTLNNLPRKQWWKLYIDAPMHDKAQERCVDPGRFFDRDESPGYQQSMINLFKKVLVPASKESQNNMNYSDYDEIHVYANDKLDDINKNKMIKKGGILKLEKDSLYTFYELEPIVGLETQERLAALKEMQEELINGRPLFQIWQSKENTPDQIVEEILRSPHSPQAIRVGFVVQIQEQVQRQRRPGFITMVPSFLQEDGPRHVNAILHSYYQGREIPNQTEYQRLREIARAVRNLHVLHPKVDGNGRTHIFGLMNKWLIEEGFTPAILPNGPKVFGGLKTLDGLVEDMLKGMHSFIKEVEQNRKNKIDE